MTFTAAEKEAITSLWSKVAGHESEIGGEALERLFLSFPQTKTYFSHFDVSHGSKDLQNHGGKVVKAIGSAAQHLNDLDYALCSLSDLHAQKLRVDPGNFRDHDMHNTLGPVEIRCSIVEHGIGKLTSAAILCLLSHAIQVTLAVHFPTQFTAGTQAAWDKFLSAVSSILVSKYR